MPEPFPGGLTAPQDWLNGILPRVPNLTPDFVKHELLTIIRDFCQYSGVWRDWLDPIILHPTQLVYSPEAVDVKAQVHRILDGYILENNQQLYPTSAGSRIVDIKTVEIGDPRYYYMTPEKQIAIFPVLPLGSPTRRARLFTTMVPLDLCVPQWLKLDWFEGISAGVLGRLYLTPGLNYKPDIGARMERRYKSAKSKALRNAVTSGTGMQEVIIPPDFAQGSGLKKNWGGGSRVY